MTSRVAWMDFDAEQQRRTQLMMAALSSQGTVDELGLGVVRDLVAGTLHPGFSVLHTRAKYLLFLPREYAALKGTATDQLVQQGRSREGNLVSRLVGHYRNLDGRDPGDDRGIIGRNTGAQAKQPASAAYWPMLRRLGILHVKGSVADYCRAVATIRSSSQQRAVLHSEDDQDDLSGPQWWAEIPEPGEFVGFDLTREEAEWLRNRFLAVDTQPRSQQAISTWLLGRERTTWIEGVTHIWDHPQREQFPEQTAEVMRLGRDLDDMVHGARILYNFLCADRRPDRGAQRDEQRIKYEKAWDEWSERVLPILPGKERLNELDRWVRSAMRSAGATDVAIWRWSRTHKFLGAWRDLVVTEGAALQDPRVAALLTHRESFLKPGRARLADAELLRNWQGDSGYLRFDYNWSVANRLLADIHRGLGTQRISMEAS